MNPIRQDVKAELENSVKLLQSLRDEVKVQLHLGGLELKEEWNRLEPKLEDALQRARSDASDTTRTALEEVTKSARRVRDALRR